MKFIDPNAGDQRWKLLLVAAALLLLSGRCGAAPGPDLAAEDAGNAGEALGAQDASEGDAGVGAMADAAPDSGAPPDPGCSRWGDTVCSGDRVLAFDGEVWSEAIDCSVGARGECVMRMGRAECSEVPIVSGDPCWAPVERMCVPGTMGPATGKRWTCGDGVWTLVGSC